MVPSRTLLAALVMLTLAAACKKSLEQVTAQYKPAIDKIVAQVKALPPRVRAVAPLTAPATSPIPGLVVFRRTFGNAVLVHERDLATPESFVYAPERPDIADALYGCISGTQTKTADGAGAIAFVEDGLKACTQIRYVLVMRTQKRRMAQMVGTAGFLGGAVSGDVLVYSLNGNYYGGFPWSAQSSDMVSVAANATQNDMQYALDAHMRDKVDRAIADGLNRAFPGSAW